MQQTKQQLLEAYLDVTQAVASSLSDLLDDQATDVTAAIPIIRQVGKYFWDGHFLILLVVFVLVAGRGCSPLSGYNVLYFSFVLYHFSVSFV